MLKFRTTIFLIGLVVTLSAQHRANVWQLGLNQSGIPAAAYYIDFNSGIAEADTLIRRMSFFLTNASICDTTGELLFYTNGIYIANRNHDSLLNCENFNPGYATDFYGDDGMGWSQGALILPKPDNSGKYLLFHLSGEFFFANGLPQVQPLALSYSEIDITLDNGLGGVVAGKKNVYIIEDTLTNGRLTACKHANGRDWWVITHEYFTDMYYKVLVTPNDQLLSTQTIGSKFTSNDPGSMAAFSPDGSRYAHLNSNDTIDYLQFDRCSGVFFNPAFLTVPVGDAPVSATLGCQFSPNSRFLYVNSFRRLWQFDTWASDVQMSRILIDSAGNLEHKSLQQAGPDGQIYIATFNSGLSPYLSVIFEPDSPGESCGFETKGIEFPEATSNHSVPNFPNYDLGSLEGSACDTLFLNFDPPKDFSKLFLKILPNPNNGRVTFQYHLSAQKDGTIEIINIHGKLVAVFERPLWSSILSTDVHLEPGMYLVRLKSGGNIISQPMMVQ